MVATRFNCFLLGLVFIFLALRDSVAYTHKAMDEMVMAATDGNNFMAAGVSPSTVEKENFEVVPGAAGAKNEKVGGRKMMEKMVMTKEMDKFEEGTNGGAPMISGANCFVGNCKLDGTTTTSTTQPVKVQMRGYMAFTADYGVAKPHPPKNN